MERCLSAHDAKCAEFTPEFRKDEQTEAGVAPRIIGIVARAATHTGAERAAQSFAIVGELKPFFERAPDAATLIDHRQFDCAVLALLSAENAAVGFRVFKDVANDFAQTVSDRCGGFQVVALSDNASEALTLLLNHITELLPGFPGTLVEFRARERGHGQPRCTACNGTGGFADLDAEPLEKTNMSEVFVGGFARPHTLHPVPTARPLPKERANRRASVQQPKRLKVAERREIHDHLRRWRESGNAGGEFKRGRCVE